MITWRVACVLTSATSIFETAESFTPTTTEIRKVQMDAQSEK